MVEEKREAMEPRSDPGTSLSLLQRVRANDQDAWHRLVHLYTPLVRYWFSRKGARPDQLDDLLQEVFRAAAGSLDTFRRERPGDTFRGWLRGITHNLWLMHLRHGKDQPQARGGTDALLRLQEIPQNSDDSDEADPPAELSGLYRRALELVRSEFEGRTWQMFWQAGVEQRLPADVAEEYGVSPAAVRKAKSRVLRRIKQEVGDLVD